MVCFYCLAIVQLKHLLFSLGHNVFIVHMGDLVRHRYQLHSIAVATATGRFFGGGDGIATGVPGAQLFDRVNFSDMQITLTTINKVF